MAAFTRRGRSAVRLLGGCAPINLDSFEGTAWVIAAHPGEEALACGGLLASLRALGRDVRVVFLTSGERSHAKHVAPAVLGPQREAEALAARAAAQLARVGGQTLPAGALANLGRTREVADQGADAARDRVEEAEQRVSEERGLYDEKRRDRRSMERLREHRHDEWRLEQSRSEQKESDAVRNERRQEGEPS